MSHYFIFLLLLYFSNLLRLRLCVPAVKCDHRSFVLAQNAASGSPANSCSWHFSHVWFQQQYSAEKFKWVKQQEENCWEYIYIYAVDFSCLISSLFFLLKKSLICYTERFSHLLSFSLVCLLSKQISTQACISSHYICHSWNKILFCSWQNKLLINKPNRNWVDWQSIARTRHTDQASKQEPISSTYIVTCKPSWKPRASTSLPLIYRCRHLD